METIIYIITVSFGISVLLSAIYIIYMGTKKGQYPKVDFSRFNNNQFDVNGVEQLVNNALRGVNGWMWLATLFMVLHYFMHFWSILFMLLNIVVVVYGDEGDAKILLLLISFSLLFTCLDMWLNSKEKSDRFHKHWFETSDITKKYIVKFSCAMSYEELCEMVIEFNESIYKENAQITLF